jgi:hypothetical protein
MDMTSSPAPAPPLRSPTPPLLPAQPVPELNLDEIPTELLAEIEREGGEHPLAPQLESPAGGNQSPSPAESASPPRPASDDMDETHAFNAPQVPSPLALPAITNEPSATSTVGESATPTAPSALIKPPAFEKLELHVTVRTVPIGSPGRGESAPTASAVTHDIAPSSDNGAESAKQLVPASADSETNEDQPLRDAKTIKSGKKTKAERKAATEKKKQRRSERGETDGVKV